MALESKLQSKIRSHLKKRGWYAVKHIIVSKSGWPDLEAIKNGRTIRIEVKKPEKDAEKLQKYVHSQIRKHGGEVYTIDTWEKFLLLNLD